ncbi:MAG: hypothetical protein R2813_02405 [Flavobacteriales bacterium]
MKKLVLFAAVAAFGFTVTSCKKDYDCTYETDILELKQQLLQLVQSVLRMTLLSWKMLVGL